MNDQRLPSNTDPPPDVAALQGRIDELERQLASALDQQTATAEGLGVISRSAFDLEHVLDSLAQSATRLCAADMGSIGRVDGDAYRWESTYATKPELEVLLRGVTIRPHRGSAIGRALLERRPIHIADVLADPEYSAVTAQLAGGYRAVLAIPLLRGGELIGGFTVMRSRPEAFTASQVKLATTFADQAVIAISNAALFQQLQERNHSLTEALERQTATSEILRVISSSPTNLQPVLDTIVANASRLCGGSRTGIWRVNGDRLVIAADVGVDDATRELLRRSPLAIATDTSIGRAALFRQVVYIPDVPADPAHGRPDLQSVIGYRSALSVPLVRENDLLGVLNLVHPNVNAYSEDQIKLIQTFADQSVIAIEITRLFTELQQRLEEQTAMGEVLQIISQSPTDLQRVLDALADRAQRLCDGSDASIQQVAGDSLRVVAAAGVMGGPRWAGGWFSNHLVPMEGSVAGRALRERRPNHVHDLAAASQDEYPGVGME